MSRHAFSRRLILGGGLLAASGALAGCSDPEPQPSVPDGPKAASPFPVVSSSQLDRVMAAIGESLTAADQAKDPARLAPRITGTAAEVRTKAYEIIGKAPEFADTLATPSAEVKVPITTLSDTFPRHAIALVGDGAGTGQPYFVALQQEDARAPYVTWGWAQLVETKELPEVPDPTNGAETVPPDADDLVMNPMDALARYAGILSSGDAADPDDRIAPDPFQQSLHEDIWKERAGLNQGVERDSAAVISEAYTVHDGEYAGLRTADGGALVMGTMRSSRTVQVKPNATVSYENDPNWVPLKLAGRASFTSTFVRDSAEVVVLHIPTADSGTQIRAIGGTKALLAAQGS